MHYTALMVELYLIWCIAFATSDCVTVRADGRFMPSTYASLAECRHQEVWRGTLLMSIPPSHWKDYAGETIDERDAVMVELHDVECREAPPVS
jgi:hypothetical protein